MTQRRALPAALACALALAPQPVPAQDAPVAWTDPASPVVVPAIAAIRSMATPRADADDAATADDRTRSFIPIPPTVLRPPQVAGRSWQICHAARHDLLSVAIAVPRGRNWQVLGWLRLNRGDCRTVLRDSAANEVYYFAHPSQARLPGWQTFCIRTDRGFETVATSDCAEGYVEAGFRRVELDRDTVRTDIR